MCAMERVYSFQIARALAMLMLYPLVYSQRMDSGSNFRRRDEHFEKLACQAVATIGRLGVYEAKQNDGWSFEQGRLLSAVR